MELIITKIFFVHIMQSQPEFTCDICVALLNAQDVDVLIARA